MRGLYNPVILSRRSEAEDDEGSQISQHKPPAVHPEIRRRATPAQDDGCSGRAIFFTASEVAERAGVVSGENTNPSSAFGTFSPLTRGEGRSNTSPARILNRVPFAPATAGEKVPKADEGVGACAMPAPMRSGGVSSQPLSRRSAAKDLQMPRGWLELRNLRSFAVYAAQDDGMKNRGVKAR